MINTNDGALSQDILNRAIADPPRPKGQHPRPPIPYRQSQTGVPTQEPQRIEGELRGMIERWRQSGCPLDESVRHSCRLGQNSWGHPQAYGFTDFLGNQQARKASDDPLRRAIGILGAAKPGKALRPKDWAQVVVRHGLAKTLIHANERDTEKGRERAIGVVLKPLIGETFEVATDTKQFRLKLEGGIRRWLTGKNPHVRYQFVVLAKETFRPEGDFHT